MALSPVEDRYLNTLTAVQFPDQPVEPETPAEQPVMLAMGGGGASRGQGPQSVGEFVSDVATPLGGLADMGAATVKGAVQGYVGLPGDLEGVARMVLNVMGATLKEDTELPTTEDVKKWLDENVGKVGDGKNPYETLGEFLAPGAYVKPARAVGKATRAAIKGAK